VTVPQHAFVVDILLLLIQMDQGHRQKGLIGSVLRVGLQMVMPSRCLPLWWRTMWRRRSTAMRFLQALRLYLPTGLRDLVQLPYMKV
jgi:hypothetical protein